MDPSEGDWDLLKRASHADGEAFAELVRRHYRAAVAFCAQVVGDEARSEDLVQRGFSNIYRARARSEDRAPFRAYLFRVLMNLSLNEIQRRSGTTTLSALGEDRAFPDSGSPDPLDVLEQSEARDILRAALGRLRPEHRGALWLREHEGLSYPEIADALGATLPEVKIWIHRARKHLAALLEPYIDRGEGIS